MSFAKKQRAAELIVGLDIGSTAVRVAVGQGILGDRGVMDLQIIAVVEVPSDGVQRGVITSIEEVVSTISSALEQTERLIGIPIESAWVGITGNNILTQSSKGVVAVAKTDGEISEEDVGRAIDAARMVSAPLNYEVLHVMPRFYAVDGQVGIKDPVGMTGVRLEVDTNIVYGLSSHLKNITKAVYRTGIDIHDLVVSIFSTGDVVTTERQREMGVAVVDIGGATTNLVVYEGGDMIHTVSLPIGSAHITNDLAIGLRTSIDVAEQLKITYGQCIVDRVRKKEMIDLQDVGAAQSEEVSRYYIAEIIGARVAEILEKVDQEFARIHRSGLLPAGVIFSGGGAKIDGLVPFAKEVLRLPAALGYPIEMQSITQKVHDIAFVPAVGLVKWGAQLSLSGRKKKPTLVGAGNKFISHAQKIFKSLIP